MASGEGSDSGLADPIAGTGTEDGGAVAGVGEAAVIEREAAAADAAHEAAAQAF